MYLFEFPTMTLAGSYKPKLLLKSILWRGASTVAQTLEKPNENTESSIIDDDSIYNNTKNTCKL